MACSAQCFGHCSNNIPCDHVSGMCPGGCQDGYLGRYCNECKSRETLLPFVLTKNLSDLQFCLYEASGNFILICAHIAPYTTLFTMQ